MKISADNWCADYWNSIITHILMKIFCFRMAPRFNYTEDDMAKAIQLVNEGSCSIYQAAKMCKVPRSTLDDKVKGKVPLKRKMGPPSILTAEEERNLVIWILELSRRGWPITKEQLLENVQCLIRELKRTNTFINDKPGRKWYDSFMKRNPRLSIRTAQNLTPSRSSITEVQLRNWFAEVSHHNTPIFSSNLLFFSNFNFKMLILGAS